MIKQTAPIGGPTVDSANGCVCSKIGQKLSQQGRLWLGINSNIYEIMKKVTSCAKYAGYAAE